MSSTMRIFINNNRITTAAKNSAGSVYQVYPVKRDFASKEEWVQHWTEALKPAAPEVYDEPSVRKSNRKPAKKCQAAPAPRVISTNPADWNVIKRERVKAFLPRGKYYIGDLCYALSDELYQNVFGGNDFESGVYVYRSGGKKSIFVVNETLYGDGDYVGSDGKHYSVDSGTLGICSVDLMSEDGIGGHIVEFKTRFFCTLINGVFTFKSEDTCIQINTGSTDEDEV